MISEISIKNFRGIKEGKIKGLRKVNILIGANNCGKSTILEALQFLRAPIRAVSDLDMPVLQELLLRRARRRALDIRDFFFRYKVGEPIEFEILNSEGPPMKISVVFQNTNAVKFSFLHPPDNQLVLAVNVNLGSKDSVNMETVWTTTNVNNPVDFIKNIKPPQLPEDKASLWAYLLSLIDELEFLGTSVFVDAELVKKIEEVERAFWGRIFEERTDKALKDSLNEIYNTRIENFNFTPYVTNPSRQESDRFKLYAALPEYSVHIDDYGEGLRYALSILTVASKLDHTALLIEEPEVHQHTGALLPIFTDLLKLSEKNHLQLFVTTHSLDVVRVLSELCDDVGIFHLTLDFEGNLSARQIFAPDAKLFMDLGVDPLRFDEDFSFLIVEGKKDKVVLESIAKKLKQKNLKGIGYQIILCPKNEQKTTISAFASTGKPIILCRDFDKSKNLENIIQSFVGSLKDKYGEVTIVNNIIDVKATRSQIKLVPLGLPDDEDLYRVGIAEYAIEDYLVKLLKIDSSLQKWMGISLEELKSRAESLKARANLNSSKTLLMTLGVIKEGMPLENLIAEIIEKSDPELLLKVLKPFLAGLFD